MPRQNSKKLSILLPVLFMLASCTHLKQSGVEAALDAQDNGQELNLASYECKIYSVNISPTRVPFDTKVCGNGFPRDAISAENELKTLRMALLSNGYKNRCINRDIVCHKLQSVGWNNISFEYNKIDDKETFYVRDNPTDGSLYKYTYTHYITYNTDLEDPWLRYILDTPHLRELGTDVAITSPGMATLDVIIEHNTTDDSKWGLEISAITVNPAVLPLPTATIAGVIPQSNMGKYLVKLRVTSCMQTSGKIFMRARNNTLSVDIEPIRFRATPSAGCVPVG